MKYFNEDPYPTFYFVDSNYQSFSFRVSMLDFSPNLKLMDNYVKNFKNHLFFIDNISKIGGHKLKQIFRKDFERLIK